MSEQSTGAAEQNEEVLAQIMRIARDEKVRLDAQVAELKARVDHLDAMFRDKDIQHKQEFDQLNSDRDYWHRRATQLETELRSIVAHSSDALNDAHTERRGVDTTVNWPPPRGLGRMAQDLDPPPSFIKRRLDGPTDQD